MTIWIIAAIFLIAFGILIPVVNITNENDAEKSEAARKQQERNTRKSISSKEWEEGRKGRIRTAFIIGAVSCLLGVGCILISNGDLLSSSSSSYTTTTTSKKCQSCNRTFTDATNKNYILHTNMCKNCYQNFCWGSGKTPKNYDKN